MSRRQAIERPSAARGFDWRRHAACRDEPVEIFFPHRGEPVEPAKAFCNRCPVRKACLEAHLDEEFGIFGGLTPNARRAVRIARRRKARAA